MLRFDFLCKRFAVIALLCTVASLVHPPSASSGGKDKLVPDYQISLTDLKRLFFVIEKDTPVAIIRFETDVVAGFDLVDGKFAKEKSYIALTGLGFGDKFQVQGTFTLEKLLQGMAPTLGHIDQTVDAPPAPQGGNDTFSRLHRLEPRFVSGKKLPVRKPAPATFLAAWPKNKRAILDATFLGPLTQHDVADILDVAEFLKKEPFSSIKEQQADTLLTSSNPWKIEMALFRLEVLKSLHPKHFSKAIKSAPVSYTESMTWELFSLTAVPKAIATETTTAVCELVGTLSPEKEKRFLKTVNYVLRNAPDRISDYVNLLQLQTAVRAYRGKIIDDPNLREVVQQLDALLALSPTIK